VRMQCESREYGPGDNFFLPAGVPHGGSIQAGYRALIVLNEADKYKRKVEPLTCRLHETSSIQRLWIRVLHRWLRRIQGCAGVTGHDH
jgi:hypothetical protein